MSENDGTGAGRDDGPGDDDDGRGDRDSGADKSQSKVARFAELVSDTQKLKRGPERVSVRPSRTSANRKSASGNHASHKSDSADGKDVGTALSAKFRWPDSQNRHRAAAAGVTDLQLLALGRGNPEPLERIDLHGTRRDAAGVTLAKRLASAAARGLDCVLVIHGRGQRSANGEAVLRDALPDWLTRGRCARDVLAFSPAPERLGGTGATLVLLRRSR